jgi:superfamily II DNA or RNA helicase
MQLGLFERSDGGLFVPEEKTPRIITSTQPLRPYQQEAVAGIRKQLEENRSTLLVIPTGTGKTRVFTDIAHTWPGRVLVLAHRDELLQQARERLGRETGEMVGLEQAEARAGLERIVVGSVQTMSHPGRLASWKKDTFGLVICDEAHHGPSPSYKRIFDHFETAKLLGVTATPDRADEKAMGQVFESVAYVYEIDDAIKDGYLCPIRVREIYLGELDLAGCRTTAGDLNQGDLDAAMVEAAVAHMVKSTIAESGDLKTLFFTTSVENATRSAELFNELKAGSARTVNGKTPIDERRQVLGGFERGDFQYLTNCGIATEGYDCPPVACIAQGRPTKSRSLHAQIVGRGLRPYPGKTDLLLLEFTGNSGKHQLASAVDILGGKYDDDEIEAAKAIIRERPGTRAGDALVEAHEAIEAKKRNEAARKLLLQARANYTKREYNPFEVMHMSATKEDRWSERFGGAVPSDAQLAYLSSRKVDVPQGLTKAKASALIGNLKMREAKGLANYNQTKKLESYGIPAINLSYKKACDLMWEIQRANGKRPDQRIVDGILNREREAGEDG